MSSTFSDFLSDKHFHITIWLNINYSSISFLLSSSLTSTLTLQFESTLIIHVFLFSVFFTETHFHYSMYFIFLSCSLTSTHIIMWLHINYSCILFFLSCSLTSTFTLLFDSILIIHVFHLFLSSSLTSTCTLLFDSILIIILVFHFLSSLL